MLLGWRAAEWLPLKSSLGAVRILDEEAMRIVIDKFRTYGKQDAVDPDLVFAQRL